jgi:NAD+ diphosphatase
VPFRIAVDGREIEQADWFARDALPDMPRPGSVARELVDAWRWGAG